MEEAAGQYALYKRVFSIQQPDRVIYLAVPKRAYVNLFQNEFGELVRDTFAINLLLFDEDNESIEKWIPYYRQLVRQELTEYAGFSADGSVKDDLIFDAEYDRYLLVSTGWEGHKRILQPVIRVDIVDGKIWVQEDNTDWPITDAFVKAGVPKEDIVLGFHPEHLRQYTGFAVS